MFEYRLDTEHAFGHHRSMERTYVRRRRTVVVVGTALVAVLLSPLAAAAVRPGHAPASAPPVPVERVVVGDGDTLWSIAQRVRPDADPRMTVDAIVRSNDVDAGSLIPGETLSVPLA
jgi:Tfp pilus assembly protein FimV